MLQEAYWWLRDNTPEDSRVLSWWDYGYQINGIANRTTIADGNTWNHEHIALLGRVSPRLPFVGRLFPFYFHFHFHFHFHYYSCWIAVPSVRVCTFAFVFDSAGCAVDDFES